jgi:sarcosine oxidase, subunit beta
VRIAVVGAGVTGLSVAFHLAERGAGVTVFERTGVGAEASGVQPGGVRQQWGTRVNCLLARESVAFYRSLNERLEPRVAATLEPCGYLFLAHSADRLAAFAADVALQQELGVPSELLEPDEVAALVPGLVVSTVTGAAYCAEDGYFDRPQAVVEAFAEACTRQGVGIEHTNVTSLTATDEGWEINHGGGAATADVVVIAAGYDTPAQLAELEVELPIVKQARGTSCSAIRSANGCSSHSSSPPSGTSRQSTCAAGACSRATSRPQATWTTTRPAGGHMSARPRWTCCPSSST